MAGGRYGPALVIALGFAVVIGLPLAVLLWAVFWPQPGRSGDEHRQQSDSVSEF